MQTRISKTTNRGKKAIEINKKNSGKNKNNDARNSDCDSVACRVEFEAAIATASATANKRYKYIFNI